MAELDSEGQADAGKAARFRSPPYPSIPLDKAIERAGALYQKSLHHSVSISVVAAAWEYAPKSSGLFANIAALKQFGLMTDEGSGEKRRFRLTDAAIRIVRDQDPLSEKRRAAIATAALSPKIYAELWGKFEMAGASGAMDMAVRSYLTLDRADDGAAPYSDSAATELLEQYKQTVAFAGLTQFGPDDSNDVPSVEASGSGKSNLVATPVESVASQSPTQNPYADNTSGPLGSSSNTEIKLNDIRVEVSGGLVRLEVLLDKDGLDKLEKKISALRDLLS